jgi:hypothetical protein
MMASSSTLLGQDLGQLRSQLRLNHVQIDEGRMTKDEAGLPGNSSIVSSFVTVIKV